MQIIRCSDWESLCDVVIKQEEVTELPDNGAVVFVPLDVIQSFFELYEREGCGEVYTLVSACSDYGLAIQKDESIENDMQKWMSFIPYDVGY